MSKVKCGDERSEERGDRVLFVERANELAVSGKAKGVYPEP